MNEPDCGEAALAATLLQSETSIAIDSTGQHVVVGFNDFRGITATTVSVSGFAYSDDGGVTFVDGHQLPVGPTTVTLATAFADAPVRGSTMWWPSSPGLLRS